MDPQILNQELSLALGQLRQSQISAGLLRQQHVQPVSGGFSVWVVPARLSIPFAHSRDVVRDAQGRHALDQLPPGLLLLQKALLFQQCTGSCTERTSPHHVLNRASNAKGPSSHGNTRYREDSCHQPGWTHLLPASEVDRKVFAIPELSQSQTQAQLSMGHGEHAHEHVAPFPGPGG